MPRYRAILENKKLLQKDFAAKLGVTEADASRLVRGKNLPTVADMKTICALLGVKPLDIYAKKEIDLLSVGKSTEPLEPQNYRFSVRLPREWCEVLLDEDKLKKCGYRDKTHWAKVCLGRLTAQYKAITNWEEKKNETARGAGNEIGLGRHCKADLPHNRKTAQRG